MHDLIGGYSFYLHSICFSLWTDFRFPLSRKGKGNIFESEKFNKSLEQKWENSPLAFGAIVQSIDLFYVVGGKDTVPLSAKSSPRPPFGDDCIQARTFTKEKPAKKAKKWRQILVKFFLLLNCGMYVKSGKY